MSDYPESEKWDKCESDAFIIGEFLEWAERLGHIETSVSYEFLLAAYFDIDPEKKNDEQKAMLREIRQAYSKVKA